MLGYRAFFNVERQSQLIGLVEGQLHSWMKTKNWDYDGLDEGNVVDVASDTRCVVLGEQLQDGSRTRRYRFLQDGHGGQWITELTAYQSRNDDGWVWLEVDQPEGARRAGTPRLATMLVEVLAVRDGDHSLTPQPMPAGASEVAAVIESVADPARRGLLFVAGSATDSDIPQAQWNGYVSRILKETVGLSSAYLLDPEATEEFNRWVPPSHRVRPYTIRTYRPEVRLDEPLDSERHRILTTASIIRDDPHGLQRLLGNRARETAISASLPSAVRRVDRRLRDVLDTLLLDRTASTAERLVDLPAAQAQTAEAAGTDHVTDILKVMLRQVFGDESVTEDSLRRLGQLALDAKSVRKANDDARQRLATLENQVDASEESIRRVTERFEDEQLERAQAEEESAERERQLRFLRTKLASMGSPDAWAAPEKSRIDTAPESFADLLSRLGEFDHVVFTGDRDHALELDDHEGLGTWSRKCWQALQALEDFVEHSRSGSFSGSVDTYLNSTPTGAHGFSPTRHASRESEDVANNPKYRRPRTLPVPDAVDSSRSAFMEAHFKIAQSGMISPRMHYFDDNSRTGKVYVGYIGRHLPTSRTN